MWCGCEKDEVRMCGVRSYIEEAVRSMRGGGWKADRLEGSSVLSSKEGADGLQSGRRSCLELEDQVRGGPIRRRHCGNSFPVLYTWPGVRRLGPCKPTPLHSASWDIPDMPQLC